MIQRLHSSSRVKAKGIAEVAFVAQVIVVLPSSICRLRMESGSVLYDPIYIAFGVSATLTSSRADAAEVAITIIERTTSADASDEFELGTLRPGAYARRRDLHAAGISPADLDGGTLVFGGRTWRIDAHAPRPGPDGESSGEVLMFLTDA